MGLKAKMLVDVIVPRPKGSGYGKDSAFIRNFCNALRARCEGHDNPLSDLIWQHQLLFHHTEGSGKDGEIFPFISLLERADIVVHVGFKGDEMESFAKKCGVDYIQIKEWYVQSPSTAFKTVVDINNPYATSFKTIDDRDPKPRDPADIIIAIGTASISGALLEIVKLLAGVS